MLISAPLTLTRETASGRLFDEHLEVSGVLTEGCTHAGCACLYTVDFDRQTASALETAGERERAEEALWAKYVALHPYGMEAGQ